MKYYIAVLLFLSSSLSYAQLTPEITSWVINPGSEKGYGGLISNVEQVQYSADNVYVSSSCIPGYDIGLWPGNPNIPKNQNFVYKITRHPQVNTGVAVGTPLGHIGVWSNGVSIFNAKDARSYNNAGVWNQNAIVVEGSSFDNCLGHPAPNGEYHHHLNPRCLYDDKDSSKHSPIIGYAFDGFPVYGAYGFAKTDGTGGITRMRSSYRMRNITDRTKLPDGTTATQAGPAIAAPYTLGYYIEDFEFVNGSGDLDEHNGRFCKTPEYPNGIYAYFVTIDSTLTAVYPYTLGLTYYGTVPAGNTGPNSGHNTIPASEAVTTYITSGVQEISEPMTYSIYPNPASKYVNIFIDPSEHNNTKLTIFDLEGKVLLTQENLQPAILYSIDISTFTNGRYFVALSDEQGTVVKNLNVLK
jgi:hypothetical protein